MHLCVYVGVGQGLTVVVLFLDPFVDDGARPVGRHYAEDGRLVLEGARVGRVAARLGEEDGNGQIVDLGVQAHVAGGLVCRCRATPLVGVESEEVDILAGDVAAG